MAISDDAGSNAVQDDTDVKAFREALIEAGKTTDTINFLWADPKKAAQVNPPRPVNIEGHA